ncbi:MAG: hypothetical protein HC839_05390 [Leptolyngbyaceae cyanobacterium RM2_2_21]|nr:hypothetical protein [Leptolyngbyaceae cyanobacterium RM2_2_21]
MPNCCGGNSIHPPARLLIQRQAFEAIGGFDPRLSVAEDYDLYLRLAAAYPGSCHNQLVVEYRRHDYSASSNFSSMQHLAATMKLLDNQQPNLQNNPEYEAAYQAGKLHWQKVYSPYLVYDLMKQLKSGRLVNALTTLKLMLRYRPQGLLEYSLVRLGLRNLNPTD